MHFQRKHNLVYCSYTNTWVNLYRRRCIWGNMRAYVHVLYGTYRLPFQQLYMTTCTSSKQHSPQCSVTCCYKTMCFTYLVIWNLIYHFIHIESNKVLDCYSRLRREHIKDDCHGSYWVQFHWFLYYTLQQYQYMVIKELGMRYNSVCRCSAVQAGMHLRFLKCARFYRRSPENG